MYFDKYVDTTLLPLMSDVAKVATNRDPSSNAGITFKLKNLNVLAANICLFIFGITPNSDNDVMKSLIFLVKGIRVKKQMQKTS